jgi:hypothetical protein
MKNQMHTDRKIFYDFIRLHLALLKSSNIRPSSPLSRGIHRRRPTIRFSDQSFRFLSGCRFAPTWIPWLVYCALPPLRTGLAGLSKFGTAFCVRGRESPRAAASAEEFRAQARPQPSSQPRLSDLPLEFAEMQPPCECRRRLDKRACLGTVEVEHVLESPQHRPPKAGTHLFRCRRMRRTSPGQPGVREAAAGDRMRAREVSSARGATTIKIFICISRS